MKEKKRHVENKKINIKTLPAILCLYLDFIGEKED